MYVGGVVNLTFASSTSSHTVSFTWMSASLVQFRDFKGAEGFGMFFGGRFIMGGGGGPPSPAPGGGGGAPGTPGGGYHYIL